MSRLWDMGFYQPQRLGSPILRSITAKDGRVGPRS